MKKQNNYIDQNNHQLSKDEEIGMEDINLTESSPSGNESISQNLNLTESSSSDNKSIFQKVSQEKPNAEKISWLQKMKNTFLDFINRWFAPKNISFPKFFCSKKSEEIPQAGNSTVVQPTSTKNDAQNKSDQTIEQKLK